MAQAATPQAQERAALEKLMLHLWQDATAGQLDTARMRLTLQPPYRARQAVMHLGVPYLKKIQARGDRAQRGALSGPAAIEVFINDTLKPIVASRPQPPAQGTRQPRGAAVKKHKTGKLRQYVSRIALAGALGLGMVSGAHLLVDALTPDPVSTPAIETVDDLRAEFARTAMGRALLDMADRGGVTIDYDPTLAARKHSAEYDAGKKRATVQPNLSPDDQILYLSHELRHAWQDLELGYADMESRMLTPLQRWVVRRFLEADAAAFSTVFLAERMQAMHHTKQPKNSGAYFEYTLAKALLREYRSADGLTAAEYREQVLTNAFAHLDSYDKKHLLLATLSVENLGAQLKVAQLYMDNNRFFEADQTLRDIKDMLATTPSDAEFEAWLRRMGGTTLQNAVKTALQDPAVTREELFNRYAELGANTARPGAAGETIARLHEVNRLFDMQVELVDQLQMLNTLKMRAAAEEKPPPRRPQAAPPLM